LPRSATSAKFLPIGWKTFSVGFQRAGLEEETANRYPETAGISGNTVQGALVDINRLCVKIQQIVIGHPELQREFGAIAA
jgi:hypothetical protein